MLLQIPPRRAPGRCASPSVAREDLLPGPSRRRRIHVPCRDEILQKREKTDPGGSAAATDEELTRRPERARRIRLGPGLIPLNFGRPPRQPRAGRLDGGQEIVSQIRRKPQAMENIRPPPLGSHATER